MDVIKYKQTEFLMPWKWSKKNLLYRFIFEIPYALYFSVVPSRAALNEVLRRGEAGGGMGTELLWQPFELTPDAYEEVLEAWRSFDLREVLGVNKRDTRDFSFIYDDEIMAIPDHLEYLCSSRTKYESRFCNKA
jgi:hypothetical protein